VGSGQVSPIPGKSITFTYVGNPADSGKQLHLTLFDFSSGLASSDPRDSFRNLTAQGTAIITISFTGNSSGAAFKYHLVGDGYSSPVVTATFGGATPTPTGTSTPGGTPQPSDTPTPSFTFTPGPVDSSTPTPLPRPSSTSTVSPTAHPTLNPYPTPDPSASALLWSDEFSGSAGAAPASDSWSAVHGTGWPLVGWGNNESESYEDYANKLDGNGSLVITASRSKGMNAAMSAIQSPWVSGKITSQGHQSFMYGKLEARIQVPAGGGTWPAFWMLGDTYPALGWPWSGELDIMEIKGNDPSKLWTSVHGAAGGGATANLPIANTTTASSAFSGGYHTYGILWQPDSVAWTLDGVTIKTVTKADWAAISDAAWPFNQAYFINLNLAMGGDFAGGVDASLTTAAMKVDWVRYSQYKGYGQVVVAPVVPTPTPNPTPTPDPSASALLWSDEFSGSAGAAPASDSWSAVHGTGWPLVGWGNNESESYEDYANKLDGNGSLVITASRSKGMNAAMSAIQSPWVSGKITSQGHQSFMYGKLEARIQVPAGGGTWPAFWMLGDTYPALGWPWSGELDIMEIKGNDPSKLWTSVHGAAGGGATANLPIANTTTASSAFSGGYHTYGILWQPDSVAWTLDGVTIKTVTKADWAAISDAAWPFNQAYFINLNLAMGGDFAGGVDASLTTAAMKVDWVRYSQYKGYGQLITK
jgi:beta-glucanase (GH16 family)